MYTNPPYNPNTTDYYSYNGQHVHELLGSTIPSENYLHPHNHRFAVVSGEAVLADGSHYHNVSFRTDSHGSHSHTFSGPSSLALPTGDGRHVHYIDGGTSMEDGHAHRFRVVTMINNPADLY